MATSSKQLFLTLIHKTNKSNVLLASGNNFWSHISVVRCSTSSGSAKTNVSNAVKAYLKKNVAYDNFLKEQLQEYNLGKKFLASMMGAKGEMTQKDVDEAIEYLFPCGLFVPKSRPIMKPPSEVFLKKKPLLFDETGRPFHFLFYTGKQNFSQILHEAATQLQKLDDEYYKLKRSGRVDSLKKLVLVGSWITKEDLEAKLVEKIFTLEYSKFIEVFNRLAEHPCGFMAENFIKQYWMASEIQEDVEIPKPITLEDGTQIVTNHLAQRKTAIANVKLISPGEGRIRINNLGLDYFRTIQSREQVLFPLIFTGMHKKIDVEATVERGGEASQAGAVRLGISRALESLVSTEMRLKMKLAGLLHRDFRRVERKKPGQEGARRKYTWLKR